jgi:protein-disulfide isomerase
MRTTQSTMQLWRPTAVAAVIVAAALLGQPAAARPANVATLRQEIEALKQGQEAIRKDLSEIKQLLQGLPRPQARAQPQPQPFQPVDLSVAGAPARGMADAPVTLIEFTDYQCPFCRRYSTETKPQLVKDYVETGKLRYVMRQFPIESLHPQAPKAAEAALCAGDQGKYWEMDALLFKDQQPRQPEQLKALADEIGLDRARFGECLDGNTYAATVQDDLKAGMAAGVRGTPAFFLGLTASAEPGQIRATETIVGAQPYPAFQQTIDRLLAQTGKGAEGEPGGGSPAGGGGTASGSAGGGNEKPDKGS